MNVRTALAALSLTLALSAIGGVAANALSVPQTIEKYGEEARDLLKPFFKKARVAYPPKEQTWICLKEEKLLLIFARDEKGAWKQVKNYPIVGVSGVAGPKLKEGDLQIPEGFYRISGLQPNSVAHLALRVNYPNDVDRANAKIDKRTNLGGDIEIHGSYWSTGCLAMGNEPIEEIFVLAHDTGCENIKLIFAPCDLTTKEAEVDLEEQPVWVPGLYKKLKASLKEYPIKVDPQWLTDIYKNLEKTVGSDKK